MIPVHHGQVKDYKLLMRNVDKWRSWLMQMNGQKVRVVVEIDRPIRSIPQNRLYWAYLSYIEAETGNTAEEIHEIAKRKFLPPQTVFFKGESYKIPGTTTKLDKLQFMDYMDRICAWSGVPIPNPNEYKI